MNHLKRRTITSILFPHRTHRDSSFVHKLLRSGCVSVLQVSLLMRRKKHLFVFQVLIFESHQLFQINTRRSFDASATMKTSLMRQWCRTWLNDEKIGKQINGLTIFREELELQFALLQQFKLSSAGGLKSEIISAKWAIAWATELWCHWPAVFRVQAFKFRVDSMG